MYFIAQQRSIAAEMKRMLGAVQENTSNSESSVNHFQFLLSRTYGRNGPFSAVRVLKKVPEQLFDYYYYFFLPPRQGGYVTAGICLSSCLSVCYNMWGDE